MSRDSKVIRGNGVSGLPDAARQAWIDKHSETDECTRLRREIDWLRSEPKNLEGWFVEGEDEIIDYAAHPDPRSITCAEWSAIASRDIIKLRRHLDSNPPEGWKPRK